MAARATSLFRRSHVWSSGDDVPWSMDVDDGSSRNGVSPGKVDGWRLMHYFFGKGFGTLARSTRRQRVRRRQTRFLAAVAVLFALWCIFRCV